MSTIYLDPDTWDMTLDAKRNIAIALPPYECAQSVANACRLWRGEAPFNNNRGIPYKDQVLGQLPPQRQLAGWYEEEALTIPRINTSVAVLQFSNRNLTGQIQCTLDDETTVNINV